MKFEETIWFSEDKPLVVVSPTHSEGIFTGSAGLGMLVSRALTLFGVPAEDARKLEGGDTNILDVYIHQANETGHYELANCVGTLREMPSNGGLSDGSFWEYAPFEPTSE